MARLTRQADVDILLQQKQALLRKMVSGISEVEQPQLGRTQYRSMDEMERALAYIDKLLADVSTDPAAAFQKRRRPIYPVVQEY